MTRLMTMLMLLAGIWSAPALAQTSPKPPTAPQQSYPRLVDALGKAGNFTTFLKLWSLAGMDRTRSIASLQDNGSRLGTGATPAKPIPGAAAQITIFAPTDAAFAAMGSQGLNALIADKAKLRSFMLAHVVQRPLLVSHLFDPVESSRKDFRNAAGWVLGFQCNGRHAGMHNQVINGKARVGAFQDVWTSEGIVHGIDAVLAP